MFCREAIRDLRELSARHEDYPPVLFFHMGTESQGDELLVESWPEARAVSDTERVFYDAFGLSRGSLWEVLGPRVWLSGLRATMKGHLAGKPVGDPMTMPGLFLVQGEHLLWRHRFRHAGERPDLAGLRALAHELDERA